MALVEDREHKVVNDAVETSGKIASAQFFWSVQPKLLPEL